MCCHLQRAWTGEAPLLDMGQGFPGAQLARPRLTLWAPCSGAGTGGHGRSPGWAGPWTHLQAETEGQAELGHDARQPAWCRGPCQGGRGIGRGAPSDGERVCAPTCVRPCVCQRVPACPCSVHVRVFVPVCLRLRVCLCPTLTTRASLCHVHARPCPCACVSVSVPARVHVPVGVPVHVCMCPCVCMPPCVAHPRALRAAVEAARGAVSTGLVCCERSARGAGASRRGREARGRGGGRGGGLQGGSSTAMAPAGRASLIMTSIF